jgi:hypothetical protein
MFPEGDLCFRQVRALKGVDVETLQLKKVNGRDRKVPTKEEQGEAKRKAEMEKKAAEEGEAKA